VPPSRRLAVAALLALAGTCTGVACGAPGARPLPPAAAPAPDRGAGVAAPAVRDVAFAVGVTCDLTTVAALAERHPDVRQFVIVATPSFGSSTGTVEVAARSAGGTWHCQRPAQPARVGRNGTRPLVERRSGDGTAPAGVFPLGSMTAWDGQSFQFFGNRPDPGVRGAYRAVRHEDCWGAAPHTPTYQKLVNAPQCPGPSEWLPRFGDVYGHAAIIGANLDPVSGDEPGEPPLAAAIFLHRHSYAADGSTRPTSGCVSLAEPDLVATLRAIDPALDPHFAIGPVGWLRSTA
jgi:L,D-peptidoglycan transpeptidase YkuD (ErfK/YbiS/YcfS/YnhG family)